MLVCQLVERDGQLLFDGKPLNGGDWIDVLVYDYDLNKVKWREVRLVDTEFGMVGDGLFGYQLNGLFARL